MSRFPEKDPYDVLGLPRGCTSYDIKTAYKKLALKNHPDRAPLAEKEAATARFKIVGEAYEFLSDDRKRREYDFINPRTTQGYEPGPEYEDDVSRKHFGTSPDGVPFSFMWESSADSARRAQAGRRAGRPFGADGHDPFELFNMMFSREFSSMNGGGARSSAQDLFGSRGTGDPVGGSLFGENDPFMQNHRKMADTMGFGFGAPHAQSRGPPGPPVGMHSAGPFGMSFGNSSSSSTTTTSYGGFTGTSESTTTRIFNGRKETVTRKVDQRGNETIHVLTPEGSTVHINGVQQAQHPLLGNAASQPTTALPHASNGTRAGTGSSADNPIVLDSESEPSAPSRPSFGSGMFNM